MLPWAGRSCHAAVASSGLPRAGLAEEVLLRVIELCRFVERLAWANASGCP